MNRPSPSQAPRTEAAAADGETSARCNICGSGTFLAGPGGRLSATGRKPRCAGCDSLERHRTLRRFYERVRERLDLARLDCLQISEDRCVEPSWFASHAVSVYGGRHSLDIVALPLASGSFGCVICNHVLEHVPDDRKAMGELFRVVADDGLLQIGVPDPLRRDRTMDWGSPDWSDHGHYRIYGMDVVDKLRAVLGTGTLLRIRERDPVTDMEDIYFVLTRSHAIREALLEIYPDARIDEGEGPAFTGASALPRVLHPAWRLRDPAAFARYVVEGGHGAVRGWVTPGALSAVTLFDGVQRSQGVKGHICEIGVHHGRFLIALSLLRQLGEKSLAVDVFDLQEFNVDRSGLGDLEAFNTNVLTWLGKDADVIVHKADSLRVSGEDVVRLLGGRVRMFSVDGSHTCAHTLNDIRIAEACLAEGGLVIVDDFLNPSWPGVVEAIIRYLDGADRPPRLVPIGYGDNKFFLTTPGHLSAYVEALNATVREQLRVLKRVQLSGRTLLHFALPPPTEMLAARAVEFGVPLSFAKVAPAAGAPPPAPPAAMLGRPERAEPAGTWACRRWSAIALELPPAADATAELVLSIDMACFRHAADPEPSVEVHMPGRAAHVVRFPPGTDRIKVALPFDRRALGPARRLEVWFRNPRAASPHELGLSSDRRVIAFRLLSVTLDAPAA